eukprot:5340774-Prymnesium_polylepis.1
MSPRAYRDREAKVHDPSPALPKRRTASSDGANGNAMYGRADHRVGVVAIWSSYMGWLFTAVGGLQTL